MRKKLLSILFVLGAFEMYGQVGVGTELPDITSQLDVVANNKGILIPRVNLIDSKSKNPIVNDGTLPNGLIVFNIATSGQIPDNVSPGLYYWLDGSWNRMMSPVDLRNPKDTVLYDPETVSLTYIDQQGDSKEVNISNLIKSNETITTLVKNQDGSYTYTNEAGQTKRIDFTGDAVVAQFDHEVVLEKIEALIKQKESQTSLVYDPLTHVLTYKPENGELTSINLSELLNNGPETLTALSYDAAAHTITYKAEDGNTTTINLSELLNNGPETLTALSYDATAHSLTYKAEDGNTTTINLSELLNNGPETLTALSYDAAAHSLTYKAEDGNTTTINLSELLNNGPETLTALSYDVAAHSLTYKAEDGNTTTINLSELLNNGPETLTALSYDATAHSLTYKAEDGNITSIDLNALVNNPETLTALSYDASAHSLTYKAEDGNITSIDLNALVNNPETLTALSYDATAHRLTYKAEDGNITAIDLNALVNNPETLTALSYDATAHRLTYKAEDGNITAIDLNALVNNPETLTALSYDATAHSLTYKAEDGNITAIDLNALANNPETITRLSYDTNTFILSYNAEDGTTTEVDLSDLVNGPETLTALVYDEESKDLIYIDEQGSRNRVNLPAIQNNAEVATSPWNAAGGTGSATSDSENIYHTGNVGIGGQPAQDTALSVKGSVKINPENDESKVSVNIGAENMATGANTLVSGKHNETHGENTAIVGGTGNTITERGEFGVIVGGEANRVEERNGTIVGSKESVADGQYSLILGGSNNMAPSVYETVLGTKAKLYSPIGRSDRWDENDRIFTIANGYDTRSNALTVLKNGNTGFKSSASQPTETIDVGEGKVRIRQIQNEDGSDEDRLVVADANGVLRTVDRRDLQLQRNAEAQIEPWLVVGSNEKARWNGQHIYQAGGVCIGHSRGVLPWAERLRLNVNGAVRGGKDISGGEIGAFSTSFGLRNKAQGAYAFVTGEDNITQPSAVLATIDGGHHNVIAENTSTSGIFSGRKNKIMAAEGGVAVGGDANVVNGRFGLALGGKSNAVNGERSVVLGGIQNRAIGINAVVAGEQNSATANNSLVFGKHCITDAENSSIIGGELNTIDSASSYSAIMAGRSHTLHASPFGFIVGGRNNGMMNSGGSVILGGDLNTIRVEPRPSDSNLASAAIIGGDHNLIAKRNSVIIGSEYCHAGGEFSMVLGGFYSRAKSFHEVIIGSYTTDYTENSRTNWDENDRLLVVGNGTMSERSNAITVLKNGNTGFKKQADAPTETIDVGSGNVRIRDINNIMGDLEDKVVVAGSDGVLKTIGRSEFKAPGSNITFRDGLMGLDVQPEETLDVGTGNVRIRKINETEGDKYQDRIVVASSTGVLKTINTGELIETLIPVNGFVAAQIREQQKQIELQSTVINTLKQSLQQMKEKLEVLEATVSRAN